MKLRPFAFIFFIFLMLLLPSGLGASRIFHVQEGDLVKLNINATDVDMDLVTIHYPFPLDANGQWQTTFNDAGEYPLNITASDGTHESVEQILLIVDNKNQPPILSEKNLVVKETQLVDLKSLVQDPDGDPLHFSFDKPFNQEGKWQTGFEDAGSYITTFSASDGEFTSEFRLGIQVLNTPKPLTLQDSFFRNHPDDTIFTQEDATLPFWIDVNSEPTEPLQVRWQLDDKVIIQQLKGEYHFSYTDAGNHTLTVLLSNGRQNLTQQWLVNVKNVNRAPTLALVPLFAREGELIKLMLPLVDIDGDTLRYKVQAPFNEKGEWLPGYDDAETYKIHVTASDGELEDSDMVMITVADVDRAPALQVPSKVDVWEGGEVDVPIPTADPDKDNVHVSFEGVPRDTHFNEGTMKLVIQPKYDVITRRGGVLSDLLNALRIERYFLREESFPVIVKSCGKDLCSSANTTIIIHNVDRPPVFTSPGNFSVTETDELELRMNAIDPDGDIVRYYFTDPLGQSSGNWKTTYDDAGVYTSYVTATDGQQGTTIPVKITVLKKNREPQIQVDDDSLVVNEGQQFLFRVTASDPDNDNVTLLLRNPPGGTSFKDGVFVWQPPYSIVTPPAGGKNYFLSKSAYLNKKFSSEQETVWLDLAATDGQAEVRHPIKVTIKNVNQPPQILDYVPTENTVVQANEPVLFHVAVKDTDNDPLTYRWDFGVGQEEVTDTPSVRRTFTTSGIKKVQVTIDDGLAIIQKAWTVQVNSQVYVAPVIPEPTPTFKVYVVEGKR